MQSSSLEKSPWGIPESPRGSGQSTKRTDCAATVRKGCPQTFGGVPSGAPPGPRDRGGIVSAARTNPHYGEDVDDKIVGTGCSEEYAKLQDCLDDTDKYGFEEQNRTGEGAKSNCVCFSSAVSAILSPAPKR
ncbi:hypothetical protein, conserved [Eimeria acervulina]|uniref:Uncharacterized protein n=1 Tax=Eimeria acervulina TaxID=5801 RepID=U6GIV0_EIMAC|nr:hypothetical protein, conserved [Eimeria acervulina]CDI79228.1 hypothetical protein, conserved [Eimeria acervulina]